MLSAHSQFRERNQKRQRFPSLSTLMQPATLEPDTLKRYVEFHIRVVSGSFVFLFLFFPLLSYRVDENFLSLYWRSAIQRVTNQLVAHTTHAAELVTFTFQKWDAKRAKPEDAVWSPSNLIDGLEDEIDKRQLRAALPGLTSAWNRKATP